MSQVTEQSVRFQTALASIKLIQASAVLDLTEDDFDFLTSNKGWIATDRSRARRCVEACVYGTFFFSSRRRHTSSLCDWSSDVCSSDLQTEQFGTGHRGSLLKQDRANAARRRPDREGEIGRASCRERVTALVSIKLIKKKAGLAVNEDEFDFITSNKIRIATDRLHVCRR